MSNRTTCTRRRRRGPKPREIFELLSPRAGSPDSGRAEFFLDAQTRTTRGGRLSSASTTAAAPASRSTAPVCCGVASPAGCCSSRAARGEAQVSSGGDVRHLDVPIDAPRPAPRRHADGARAQIRLMCCAWRRRSREAADPRLLALVRVVRLHAERRPAQPAIRRILSERRLVWRVAFAAFTPLVPPCAELRSDPPSPLFFCGRG